MKMLRRQAKLEPQEDGAASVVSQQALKLNIPKKTRLFIDQTMRERENPLGERHLPLLILKGSLYPPWNDVDGAKCHVGRRLGN